MAAGLAAFRHSPRLPVAATMAATLLIADAWFDTLTASSSGELAVAFLEAVFAELPVAAICIWLALFSDQPAARRRRLPERAVHRSQLRLVHDGHVDPAQHRSSTGASTPTESAVRRIS